MSIELIGLITFAFAAAGLVRSVSMALTVLCIAAIFKAAAAMFIGSANITPGYLSLGFFLMAVAIRKGGLYYGFRAIAPPSAGFILLVITLWGLFSSFILPRIFAGQFQVFPMSSATKFINLVPLMPTSSNFNQAIYGFGSLIAFASVAAMARNHRAMDKVAIALVAAAGVNVAIAVIDVTTYALGLSRLLEFMRNAEYAQLFTHEFMGIKRVTGSFPEASAFAGTSVGLFAFVLRLWRGAVMPKITGPIAAATFLAILLALSSTGYVALGVYLICVYSRAVTGFQGQISRSRDTEIRRFIFVSLGPLAALSAAVVVAINPDLLTPVTAIFDNSISDKLGSASGKERMSWNMAGINAFVQTAGLGAGMGSVRTSSFLIAVASNLGVLGIVLYTMFLMRIFRARRHVARTPEEQRTVQIAAASRSGCFAILLSSIVSATSVNLGILFFVMAGAASAAVLQRRPAMFAPGLHRPDRRPAPLAPQARSSGY